MRGAGVLVNAVIPVIGRDSLISGTYGRGSNFNANAPSLRMLRSSPPVPELAVPE